LDSKGNLLATSVRAFSVCADPSIIGNRQLEVARVVAPLLQMSETEVVQKINARQRQNAKGEIINTSQNECLKQKVPQETWLKIQAAMRNFGVNEKKALPSEQALYRNIGKKGIYVGPPDQLRLYTQHAQAAHVLGFVATEPLKINGPSVNETIGREGIEATFNSKLAGVRGWRITEKDSRHREVVPMREQEVQPRDGLNVVLTLDSAIQNIVEETLAEGMEKNAPQSISAIVVRPRTGEILAMATLPNFDPNHLDSSSAEARR